jgi:hypothetical protein
MRVRYNPVATRRTLVFGAVALAGGAVVMAAVAVRTWHRADESMRIQHGPSTPAQITRSWVTVESGKTRDFVTTHLLVRPRDAATTATIEAPGRYTGLVPGAWTVVRYDPAAPGRGELPGHPMNTRGTAEAEGGLVVACAVLALFLAWTASGLYSGYPR